MTDASHHVKGFLALELSAGGSPTVSALRPADAGALVERLGRDLAALVPGIRELDLSLAAAHFDPAEALRPGWPLHRRLEELYQRAPGRNSGPRMIAFGADESGDVPMPFQASEDLHGGALRVLPFLLSGSDAAALADVADQLEAVLLETGMAQADTALLAQQSFNARIEHARYLTLHDLAALTAMQYGHGGLEALWPVIETALLAPQQEAWLDHLPEPLLRYADGEVRIALFEPTAWRQRYAPEEQTDERLERAFGFFQARQQQFAAVLDAHGIPVTFAHCPATADPRGWLVD
ncbi:hypothetical protein [Pseudoxanthomonas indica]|uniref:Uncharacterized protein n=1 Tax=Pseudoxanthomonas indica TaxID=428993 RepID=A0A1T5KSD1_9GAMM|nr:hypothetical protein [Pseudoxanthomonas indica]GGD51272.1 hypothetical protein GCM10007235_24350 [Pseudoxanthomonas indica]SKC66686.1 hypothetical protein SAMN06296058_1983 [Pseudoxanthomonas indica]